MIEIKNIKKAYGKNVVIEDLSLTINEGEKIALIAPSGCGKTTLLHIIAGLTRADGGSVSGFESGQVCMLFQENRLFPCFTALENVMSVLKEKKAQKKQEALEWLKKVELSEEDAHKMPSELSGGQQQRVALARTLASRCPIVLLDEPFKGLDAETKGQIYDLANKVLSDKTLLLVTHDPEDAAALECEILRFAEKMKLIR